MFLCEPEQLETGTKRGLAGTTFSAGNDWSCGTHRDDRNRIPA